jgi:hypothetical protein
MTDGKKLEDSTTKIGFDSIIQLIPNDARAREQYDSAIKWIEQTNAIQECRVKLEKYPGFASRMLQCRLFRHVVLDILHGLTYEILGIRPLLIDKLSSILIPKDGVLLPRKDPAYQL